MTRRGRTFDACRLTNNGPTDESVLAILLSKPGQFRWTPPIILWLRGTEIKSITSMHAAGVALVFGLAMDRRGTSSDLKSRCGRVFACFPGSVFPFSGDFCPIWSILVIFGGRFSTLQRFFNFEVRYTRAEDPTLYYSPSETSTEARQLGPRAYRIFYFCPACGFRILGKACFTQIMLKYCRGTVHGTHRTRHTHGTRPGYSRHGTGD